MLTDYGLASFCSSAYDPNPKGTVIDHYDLRIIIRDQTVTVRGTVLNNFENWIRDFYAIPISSDFGLCHAGFLLGALNLFPLVSAMIEPNYTFTGHSLGGAVMIILGAMLIQIGKPPSKLVTFESPRAGGIELRKMYDGIPITQYKYGNDPVPDVPYMPGVYENLVDLTRIGENRLDPIDCHFISMTVDALRVIDKNEMNAII